MVCSSLLETIGRTPVVHMKRYSEVVGVEVYAKLESLNPGGSHKARIALGMLLDAEQRGLLWRGRGQTIVEPSGGNTGIGLAIAANLLGYRLLLVIPDNYSVEKQKLLRLYGAEIVLSNSKRGNNSHGEKALEIQMENPEFVMLNQQRNPANPQTHRDTTAREVISDLDFLTIDAFVGGIGTGGHLTGVGEVLKSRWPNLSIYGVEPEGCDLLNDQHSSHDIQGLSVGLIPAVLNCNLIDAMVTVSKTECVDMSLMLLRTEAISMGISSAANFVAIKKLAKSNLSPGMTVFTMVYDGIESYLNYFE